MVQFHLDSTQLVSCQLKLRAERVSTHGPMTTGTLNTLKTQVAWILKHLYTKSHPSNLSAPSNQAQLMKKANYYVESPVIDDTSYKTVATKHAEEIALHLANKDLKVCTRWVECKPRPASECREPKRNHQQMFFVRWNQEPGSPSHWKKMPLLEEPLLKDKSMSWQCFFSKDPKSCPMCTEILGLLLQKQHNSVGSLCWSSLVCWTCPLLDAQ